MRRITFAVALLLATAPVARAETPVPAVQPDLQVVQVAAPTVRQDAVEPTIAKARNEATTKATAQMGMSRNFWVLLVAVGAGALVLLALA